MEQRELGKTGLKVSPLGFGAAPLGGMYGELDEARGIEALHRAIERGFNLVDTSPYYMKSEEVLGRALRGGWRDKIILSTKGGRIAKDVFDFSPIHMTRSLENSLRLLGTDHVDIFIAHDIEFADDLERVFTETADVLHQLKTQGKCRFVGMSSYPLGVLVRAVERCGLDVVLSYCHYSLLDTTLMSRLLPVTQRHDTAIINASPLAMGLLTNAGPPAWHPADAETKAACRAAADLCRQRGVELALLAVQFVLSQPELATTLVGISTPEELESNLRAMETTLNFTLLTQVERILTPVKNRTWPSGKQGD